VTLHLEKKKRSDFQKPRGTAIKKKGHPVPSIKQRGRKRKREKTYRQLRDGRLRSPPRKGGSLIWERRMHQGSAFPNRRKGKKNKKRTKRGGKKRVVIWRGFGGEELAIQRRA